MGKLFLGRDARGKRCYRARTFDTKRDAQRWLTSELRAKDTGTLFTPSKEALTDFLDRWLRDVVRPSVQATTAASYSKMIRLHVRGEVVDYRRGSSKSGMMDERRIVQGFNHQANRGEARPLGAGLVVSYGIGGQNTALVLRKVGA